MRSQLFKSFWQGGFEGADHLNSRGNALAMNDFTQHRILAVQDYSRLADFDIETVRESVGWRLVERDGRFDFSSVDLRAQAAEQFDVQVIWTLCHYGWPAEIDVFSDQVVERFSRYCKAAAAYLSQFSTSIPTFAPIYEISFLTYAISETNLVYPHTGSSKDRGYELKKNLVRAAIAGCEAIWEVDPGARIIHTDPLIHIIAAHETPELVEFATRERSHQFQAWDMLGGLIEPQLGGDARHLEIVGINYYHSNQWQLPGNAPLQWHLKDERRLSFRHLLADVHHRYGRPLLIAETSHVGIGRGEWLTEIAREVAEAQGDGVPIEGICIYPIIDRPDWEEPGRWHNSGLWDLVPQPDGTLERVLCGSYARDLCAAQLIAGPLS